MRNKNSRITRATTAVGVIAVAVLVATGCATDDDSAPVPVTETVTAPPVTSPASESSAASSTPATAAGLSRALSAVVDAADQPVGVSVVAVGAPLDSAVTVGDQTPQVAWSTIKVPLAVAAERENGQTPAQTSAIVDSDNAAAEQLWVSLGTPAQAAASVTDVLRDGGDPTTTVPSQQRRAGFTIFGQTVWPLPNAATFTANLPCIDDSEHVLDLMGRVAGNQQWGVEIMALPKSTAVKGGWGPGTTSGYLVRQIGLLTYRDGSMTAVAMSTTGASMSGGIATLNAVANGLNTSLRMLPRGRCVT